MTNVLHSLMLNALGGVIYDYHDTILSEYMIAIGYSIYEYIVTEHINNVASTMIYQYQHEMKLRITLLLDIKPCEIYYKIK